MEKKDDVVQKSPEETFRLWASAHEPVIQIFLKFAREVKAAGGEKYFGITAITARVRWESIKINNNYCPRLARLLVERDPSLDGVFKFHRLRSCWPRRKGKATMETPPLEYLLRAIQTERALDDYRSESQNRRQKSGAIRAQRIN